jgi:hypothetical protein
LIHVAVTCTGISPLLMNALSEEQLLKIRNKDKAPKTAAKPTLRDEALTKLHCLQDGRPCLPTNAFFKTLINAGQFVRLDGKRQVSTAKSTILTGMLAVEDTILPLFKPGTEDAAGWEVDIQQGKNPNGGEAVCIVRPRFDEWEVRATIEVDQTLMPLSMARELFDIAGKRIGFLEFSPRCRGTFGRWHVTKWEAIPAAT